MISDFGTLPKQKTAYSLLFEPLLRQNIGNGNDVFFFMCLPRFCAPCAASVRFHNYSTLTVPEEDAPRSQDERSTMIRRSERVTGCIGSGLDAPR